MRKKLLTLVAGVSVVLSLGITAPSAIAAPADPPGTFTQQNLGETLADGFASYRIPALAYLGNNVVVAAWDGRPGSAADAPNPNSIVIRRSTDNGATWSAQTVALAGNTGANKYGYSDPSFVYDGQTGALFMFTVYSKDQGLFGSSYGNDDADRNVISAIVAKSTDGGVTWGTPQFITNVVKPGSNAANPQPGDVQGMFATSGEGIQLKYGAHAGRLVQQFAGTVRQANGSTIFQAYSVYSDDHGATWKRGAFVGTGMDENKVVELSDGSLMMNSRSSDSAYRKVSISTNGGESWGPVRLDQSLPDPRNNASITRLFPDAAQGTADAAKLLFTNSDSLSSRTNLSARVSCDNGATWIAVRPITQGSGAYSTATRLGNGQIGVLYESSSTNGIQFARFDDAWLDYTCPTATSSTSTINGVDITGSRNDGGRNVSTNPYQAGESVAYSFRVVNTGTSTVTVSPTSGNFSPLAPPDGGNCRWIDLAAGGAYTCSTPRHTVTADEVAQGYFVPTSVWTVQSAATSTATVVGPRVPLR